MALPPTGLFVAMVQPMHWMSPQGVTCSQSLGQAIIHSTTDTEKVTCNACLLEDDGPQALVMDDVCSRCDGKGYDPEEHANDPLTGAPEPVACLDCGGSGTDRSPYEDDDWYY